MLKTPIEIAQALGHRVKLRRLGVGWTQVEAARRAGVSYATWRRIEADGKASVEDLVKAAVALRCERELDQLFPPAAAGSMDELLAQQNKASAPAPRQRVRRPTQRRAS